MALIHHPKTVPGSVGVSLNVTLSHVTIHIQLLAHDSWILPSMHPVLYITSKQITILCDWALNGWHMFVIHNTQDTIPYSNGTVEPALCWFISQRSTVSVTPSITAFKLAGLHSSLYLRQQDFPKLLNVWKPLDDTNSHKRIFNFLKIKHGFCVPIASYIWCPFCVSFPQKLRIFITYCSVLLSRRGDKILPTVLAQLLRMKKGAVTSRNQMKLCRLAPYCWHIQSINGRSNHPGFDPSVFNLVFMLGKKTPK